MFCFSQFPFSTFIFDYFNGIITDSIILEINTNNTKLLDITKTHNIILQIKRQQSKLL